MTQHPLVKDPKTAESQRSEAELAPRRQLWRQPPLSWAVGFVLFWYRFIIGDDWTLAAVVAAGMTVTALLHAHGISIWWLVPALVIVVVGIDLERASRRHRGP